MSSGRGARALVVILSVVLFTYAALVVRDFYRFSDHLVYVSVDDGLANQAFVLASEGRFGFLSSPTLLGIPRHEGEFSYGPWYFSLGALLIWLFGYSLELVRSIHLWVIVGAVGAARYWFRGTSGVVASTLFGLLVLRGFDVSMWPMARPDSMVSGFAVALLVLAGLAMTRHRPAYWFGTGLAASCGAFTHLVAWSLVPASIVMFGTWALMTLHGDDAPQVSRRGVLAALVAFAGGGLLGATMFYAAFDFRFWAQARYIAGYDGLVASTAGYWTVLAQHVDTAFDYVPVWQRWTIVGALAAAWGTLWPALRTPSEDKRILVGCLLPPTVVWSFYLISSGWYPNHHKGYAILHQVAAFWMIAALLWSWLRIMNVRRPRLAAMATVVMALAVLVQGGNQLRAHLDEGPAKEDRARRWVSITDHTHRVLAPIPVGATAWGSVMFGIETPHRIQLIQTAEGLVHLPSATFEQRLALAPEYLIWGYPEARDNMLIVIHGGDSLLERFAGMLPGVQYRLGAIVAAPPYGVTRVYARVEDAGHIPLPMPDTSVYSTDGERWLSRLGPPFPVTFQPAAPVEFHIGYAGRVRPSTTDRTVSADLPAGPYLLRVSIRPGGGQSPRRLLAATSATQLRQVIGELGPRGDFAGYWADQTEVLLLAEHEGGLLHVSQYDDGQGAAIVDVEALPVLGMLDPHEVAPDVFALLPEPRQWLTTAGVESAPVEPGTMRVEGDDSRYGYQLLSPAVPAESGDRVSLELGVAVQQGAICTGVLNGTQASWIVAPDRLRAQLSFVMDRSGRFFVVVANCHESPEPDAPSRFTLGQGRVRVETSTLYTDRFMAAVFGSGATDAVAPTPLLDVIAAPVGLAVSTEVLTATLEPVNSPDLAYRSPLVQRTADAWVIAGRAETPFTYLLRDRPRPLDARSRVVVTGDLEAGGITVGLLRGDAWAVQAHVTEPGPFTVVVAPPGSGAYSIVVAKHLAGASRELNLTISKLGVVAAQ